MEAKDTVMNDEEIQGETGFGEDLCGDDLSICQITAKRQAEITWDKAIREVVETTIYLALANGMVSIKELFELHEEGKAKLKEWRL